MSTNQQLNPISTRLDTAVDKRLAELLKRPGLKFPAILNLALSDLLDRMDDGATIAYGQNGLVIQNAEGQRQAGMTQAAAATTGSVRSWIDPGAL